MPGAHSAPHTGLLFQSLEPAPPPYQVDTAKPSLYKIQQRGQAHTLIRVPSGRSRKQQAPGAWPWLTTAVLGLIPERICPGHTEVERFSHPKRSRGLGKWWPSAWFPRRLTRDSSKPAQAMPVWRSSSGGPCCCPWGAPPAGCLPLLSCHHGGRAVGGSVIDSAHRPSSALRGAQSWVVVPSLVLKENENSVLQSHLLCKQTHRVHSSRHSTLSSCGLMVFVPIHGANSWVEPLCWTWLHHRVVQPLEMGLGLLPLPAGPAS